MCQALDFGVHLFVIANGGLREGNHTKRRRPELITT